MANVTQLNNGKSEPESRTLGLNLGLFLFFLFLFFNIYSFVSFFNKVIYFYFWLCWVFVAACGLFSSCGEQGLLFTAVRGLHIAVVSLVAEHGL